MRFLGYTKSSTILQWIFFIGCVLLVRDSYAQIEFVDVTEAMGIGNPGDEAVIWLDYNNDGLLDLAIGGWFEGNIRLFLNRGDGFQELSDFDNMRVLVGDGAALGDYNNDGLVDIYLTGARDAQNTLFRNEGNATFADVTRAAGVNVPGFDAFRSSASFVDFDNDGDLDLFAADATGVDYLYRNDGGGTFVNVVEQTGFAENRATPHHMFGDYDNDGWMDLYAPNNAGLGGPAFSGIRDALYRNNRDGSFTDMAQQAGINHPNARIEGVLFMDYNNDGWLDIFLADFEADQANRLYGNNGDGSFSNRSVATNFNDRAQSVNISAADYDNDGWQEVFVTTLSSESNFLYRNNRGQSFSNIINEVGLSTSDISIIGNAGDFNADGFMDLFVTNFNPSTDALYRNKGNTNHWLHVNLVGIQSNRSAIGTRVRVVAGDLSMIREVHGGSGYGGETLTVEFGLGAQAQADQVEIRWPSGQVNMLQNIASDQHIRVFEGKDAFDVIRPTQWEHTLPASVPLESPFSGTATVRPSLFESDAEVIQVLLTGLGDERSVALQKAEDGTYRLNASDLFLTGALRERMLTFQIEQSTSLGTYITSLPVIMEATASVPPVLSFGQSTVVFGEVEVERTSRAILTVRNEGLGSLLITDVRSEVSGFSFDGGPLIVLSGESQDIAISFFPQVEGEFSGIFEVHSNDREAIVQISFSGRGVIIPADPRADVDGSGKIDFPDFLAFAQAFGASNSALDFDGNGTVDFPDFLLFAKYFGKSVN